MSLQRPEDPQESQRWEEQKRGMESIDGIPKPTISSRPTSAPPADYDDDPRRPPQMSTVHIEVSPNGRDGKVVVDGHDIAKSVRGFTIRSEVNRAPSVEIDLGVHDVTTFESSHAQVLVGPAAAGFLERAGWTPPPGVRSVLPRRADGCPCERVDVGWAEEDPAEQKTIPGRTVPTCPVHCPHGTALHRARVEAYGQGRDDEAAAQPLRYEGRR